MFNSKSPKAFNCIPALFAANHLLRITFISIVVLTGCRYENPNQSTSYSTEQSPELKSPPNPSAEEISTLDEIPELTAVDVYMNFTNKGFELTKQLGTEECNWLCRKYNSDADYTVDIYGKDPETITAIYATLTNHSNANTDHKGKDFLGYVSTIQYQNATPEEAKEWVVKNINKRAKAKFGGVIFNLVPKGKIRMLIISVRKSDEPN